MTTFAETEGFIDGAAFRFRCPRCSTEHTWSADQVMSMADRAIADYCSNCGGGVRVLKPAASRSADPELATNAVTESSRSAASIVSEPQVTRLSRPEAYRYKVIPFIGRTQGAISASDVARQLESTINQHACAGWEFYQLSDVNIEIQPGCIAGLLGATVQYVRYDQLIFRSTT